MLIRQYRCTIPSYIEVKVQLVILFLELISHSFAHEADLSRFSVVKNAIVKDELYIVEKFLNLHVFVIL
jgi:hypothetical protein